MPFKTPEQLGGVDNPQYDALTINSSIEREEAQPE